MIEALNKKGFKAYSISVPSPSELLQIFKLAAPVFVTMMSKVGCISLYSLAVPVHVIVSAFSDIFYTFCVGVLLLSYYIFCYLYGYTHCCCSSGWFDHDSLIIPAFFSASNFCQYGTDDEHLH